MLSDSEVNAIEIPFEGEKTFPELQSNNSDISCFTACRAKNFKFLVENVPHEQKLVT